MSAGGVNANRRYSQDPPWKLSVSIPESLRVAIDVQRGEQSRTAWIIEACEAWLEAGREGDKCPF